MIADKHVPAHSRLQKSCCRMLSFIPRAQTHPMSLTIEYWAMNQTIGAIVVFIFFCATSFSQDSFETVIRPFLQNHCKECHSGPNPDGKLDIESLQARSVSERFATWKEIERRVLSGSMPPKDATALPSEKERQTFVELSRTLRRDEAFRSAGDPGIVSVRRLSNAEYNNTLRDFTI